MTLQEIIDNSNKIVFFGGAGVSTESGIPDFRSANGIYNDKTFEEEFGADPEYLLSSFALYGDTEKFYKFHRSLILSPNNGPNTAHKKLVELENAGKLSSIITQNIDGLHQEAGSKNVIELHGNAHSYRCIQCSKKYDDSIFDGHPELDYIPRCTCWAIVRPEIVLYGENLDDDALNRAIDEISSCDTLIVAGTSLTVYPAAGLVKYFRGKHFVIINKSWTPFDDSCDLKISDSIGKVLGEIKV